MNDYGGIVLAGGKSNRMGEYRDKAMELLGGKKLLEWSVELLSRFTDNILIVGRGVEKMTDFDATTTIRFINDVEVGKGPLGGIFTGLVASPQKRNYVIACDMPFIKGEILNSLRESDDGRDAIVLKAGGIIQPLVGIYDKSCIEPMKEFLLRGNLAVHRFLESISVIYVEFKDDMSLFDIDSPDDMEEAHKRLRENGK